MAKRKKARVETQEVETQEVETQEVETKGTSSFTSRSALDFKNIHSFCTSLLLSKKSFQFQRTEDALDQLEPLTQYTWDLYRVSPWYGFEFSEARLKQYGLHLQKYFAQLDIEENVAFKAEFSVLEEFQRTDEDLAVKVEVRCNKDKSWKIIYGGIFLSWGSERKCPETLNYMPLLLCRGRITFKQVVHESLQKFFDCSITNISFSHTELKWFNGLFVSMSSATGKKVESALQLTLRPPWQSDSNIEYRCILEDAKNLWKRIHQEDSDIITVQEVVTFYDALLEIISQQFKFKLQDFKIEQITYPGVSIKSSGKLKCKDVDIWNEMLHMLCDVPLVDVSKMNIDESS